MKLSAGGAVAGAAPGAFAQAPVPAAPAAPPAPPPFTAASVLDRARELSGQPYRAPSGDLPAAFANLNYEQYIGIRAKAGSAIWSDEPLPFLVEPLHRGFIFPTPMQIFLVEDGAARPLGYDPAQFDFGKVQPPANPSDIGFSGFRVLRRRPGGGALDTAIFQGASFFRAVAHGQNYGVIARALNIRTAEAKGEEFPLFRAVWIEKPSAAASALVIHGLLDSESITGAYRFTLRPGEATIVDVECTLFPRVDIDHYGLAGMQATHLFSPMERRRFDDYRPAVFEAQGLQMLTGADEWLWRPVANRENLQVSAFVDRNPKRFGLMMRRRQFSDFLDDDQHWEIRPSLWIEPMGEWGEGTVQLVEIPADSEVNDNIVAYWRPKPALQAGAELNFTYRQFWCWQPPDPVPLAVTTESRSGRVAGGRRRRFLVEFTGEVFGQTQEVESRANLSAQPGTIVGIRTFLSREARSLRVLFEIDPGSETSIELRLVIVANNMPVSEAWLYRWTP